MTTVLNGVQQRKIDDAAAKDQAEFIPETIEERRKDSEGRSVLTKYTRGKLLGKGGFAKCFLGTHIPSNHQYALKIVYKSTLAKSSAKQKLQTEIKIHRMLKHSFIVKFERFFEDNTNVYMVLELCNNNSLSNLLKRRKKLTELEVRYYLNQLVGALKYLHDNLVIHRDLKLGNLFLDSHMRLKVGDFGLATKMLDPLERKKTFCGTPNYIAPEILEGKNGHSFEVDIWSTGVIMYTLLVGKPPFESKNVESTYKRILSNSFSFPEEITVCEHAKSLIRKILQTSPESRPTLEQILQHSFFTKPGSFIPDQLPECALRVPPLFQNAQLSEGVENRKGGGGGGGSRFDNELQFGNENDPQAANKNICQSNHHTQYQHNLILKNAASIQSNLRLQSPPNSGNEYVQKENVHEVMRPPTVRQTVATGNMVTGLSGLPLRSRQLPNSPPYQSAISAPPQKRERLFSTNAASEKRSTHTNKFEIFEDNRTSSQIPESVQVPLEVMNHNKNQQQIQAQALKQRILLKEKEIGFRDRGLLVGTNPTNIAAVSDAEKLREQPFSYSSSLLNYNNNDQMNDKFNNDNNNNDLGVGKVIGKDFKIVPSSSSSSRDQKQQHQQQHTQQSNELDQLQSKLEFIQINNNDLLHIRTTTVLSNPTFSHIPAENSSKRQSQSTWTGEMIEKSSAAVAALSTPSTSSAGRTNVHDRNMHYVNVHEQYLQDNNKSSPGHTSEPMQLGTPQNQIMLPNAFKAPCTLETMHEVLSSQDLDDLPQALKGKAAFQISGKNRLNMNKEFLGCCNANVWVERYVDYTSKYGLGFLLNTGSAGVYFNDSTKIVVSPDGNIFQYSERKKKEKGSSSSEHNIQTHSVLNFPTELQKKVTLLRHFRNYLVDQQKEGSPNGDDGSAVGGSAAMEKMATLEGASSGATPLIPLGKSSKFLSLSDATSMGCSNLPTTKGASEMLSGTESFEMPFLKKWVRTKHAILFRLSNRTVQVLFMDRSEVLLTSEARMVTYVSKQNIRSEHSLEEVLQTGRSDIAKRLKYAKDIMYRLINTQVR